MKSLKIKKMTEVALITALICVLSPLVIPLPFSPVPISLTIFAIYIGLYVLGWKWGVTAALLYVLIGLIGIPVFASFTAGPAKLFGPTGGYIIGYVLVAVIAGFFIEHFKNPLLQALGMALGTLVCYTLGTLWLAHLGSMTFAAALAAGVIPFIPADIVKIILALIIGPILHKAVIRINS